MLNLSPLCRDCHSRGDVMTIPIQNKLLTKTYDRIELSEYEWKKNDHAFFEKFQMRYGFIQSSEEMLVRTGFAL